MAALEYLLKEKEESLEEFALVRLPADTVDCGLRMEELGKVDVALAQLQHRVYCDALRKLGFGLVRLQKENAYPDSVFVEDPAVIIKDVLVVARLRRKERSGEEQLLEQSLSGSFSKIFRIETPGFLEGGDVLITEDTLFIGISGRTNEEGAEQLARIARDQCGYGARMFEIPENQLHLKGGVTYHARAGGLITVSEEYEAHFRALPHRRVVIPAEERFGANCISAGATVLVHAQRPRTKKLLEAEGFEAHELFLSEFEKIDGAMTCLSKFFRVT